MRRLAEEGARLGSFPTAEEVFQTALPADPDPISTARKPQICLRLANATATNKNETVSLQERFEIVSLTGTISLFLAII